MSQQINLFNPIFLKQKKHFSAVTMAQGLGLILLGSVAMAGYARVQLSILTAEAEDTASQLKATKAQLAKVSAAYAPRQPSKSLENEITRIEADIRSQQQAFEVIRKGGVGNTKGYSEYLRAFSRQAIGGLWLTGFTIRGAGINVELRGRALQPDLVPAYINRLKQEPVMRGKSFAMLAMQVPEAEGAPKAEKAEQTGATRPQVTAQYIEFVLRSADGSAGGAAPAANGIAVAASDAVAGVEGKSK